MTACSKYNKWYTHVLWEYKVNLDNLKELWIWYEPRIVFAFHVEDIEGYNDLTGYKIIERMTLVSLAETLE